MQLRLRTRLTLVMTALILLAMVVPCGVFVGVLMDQILSETDQRANDLARQVFHQAQYALTDAKQRGSRPASADPSEIHDYVRHTLEVNDALHGVLADGVKDNEPLVYEASIVDENGLVFVSSDPALQGTNEGRRAPISQLVAGNFFHQIRLLYGRPELYELNFPFDYKGEPFGEVRVGLSSLLLRTEISPFLERMGAIVMIVLLLSAALAAFVSRIALAPLGDIAAQLDRISAGQYDFGTPEKSIGYSDELGQVSRKITKVGQQLRGVHEIFSTLRQNLNSVMAGLEDGLVLFTGDARAVMVSPAAEKFLGAPASAFLGKKVNDIFPPGHPLHDAVRLEAGELSEAAVEADVQTAEGKKRVGVTVQAVQEKGERVGALVTLRDLDSLENINTQLQVSERLAAVGRITAGVAHEVKNPLNSMRLWLENLKESMPEDADGVSKQAVRVLDNEIDRLDAVVKRFLDFTKPMEVRLELTQLADVLQEVLQIAAPQMERAGVRVAQLLPIDVPEVYVDRALFKQAILNLVLNAGEAMPGGGQLSLVLSRRAETAEISVADTGKGIPPEHQQKIFQLFFTTRPGGSGIGLASTFRIVQLLNGSIDFTSEPGRGTTFRIALPLAA